MSIADEIHLAHERQIEDLRREIGTLRHELDVARGERDLAFEDLAERQAERAYVAAGWRLVTGRGHVVLDSRAEQPTAWGGRGHRIYVKASERR